MMNILIGQSEDLFKLSINNDRTFLFYLLLLNHFTNSYQMTTRNPIAIDDDSWFTSSDSKSKKSAKGFTNYNIPVINMVITMIRDVVKIE